MDQQYDFDRDRFGGKYWVTPVHSFGKSSPGQPVPPRQKHTPLVSPRGSDGFFSAASNGTSAFSPVTPREPAAQPPPPKSAGPQSHRSILQLSPQSPEAELAQVAMRCVSLSDQLSSCKEQLREALDKIEGLERHLVFSKDSMIDAVNGRDAIAKQFNEHKESTKRMVDINQRNTMLLKQQVQAQCDRERAHAAQVSRMNAQHQEALDILREKLSAATQSNTSHQAHASDLQQTLTKAEAAAEQELQMLRGRLAACEVAERTVQSSIESGGGDFSAIIEKLISADCAENEEAKYERAQVQARVAAAVAGVARQRDELLRDSESLKIELAEAKQKECSSRSQFEDFISELQRQLSACMSREATAIERIAVLSKELEDTTSSSVAAISASASDISSLRARLSECEAHQAALKVQLKASEFELDEVHVTLSDALKGDTKFNSSFKLSSSREAELQHAHAALKELADKEALARSQIADYENKLADSQAVEAAARSRVNELEAAAKLWDAFVQEHMRKSQASVQLQSLLAAKSALAEQQEKEISSLRLRADGCDRERASLRSRLGEVEAANIALQEQLAGTCFELDEVHATMAQVLERESAAAKYGAGKESALRAQIAELDSKLLESQTVEAAARACVLELEAALKFNMESLSARSEELEQFKGTTIELEHSLAAQSAASSHEMESLKLQLADSEISKISVSDELVTARCELEIVMKSRSQLSAELDTLQSQHSRAQSELASLAAQLSSAKSDAEGTRVSLKDSSARESLARRKEFEASAQNQDLLEKLYQAQTRMREVEGQLETQTAFSAASSKVSVALRDACGQSEILIAQMKQNLNSSASREATARKRIAELGAQMSGYESYFSQTRQLQSGSALFGIGLFIVSMSVAPGGFSTPRSSPLTPGKKGSSR